MIESLSKKSVCTIALGQMLPNCWSWYVWLLICILYDFIKLSQGQTSRLDGTGWFIGDEERKKKDNLELNEAVLRSYD